MGMYQLNTTQLPKFTFDGDNHLEFLQGFPDVAAHFSFTELINREHPQDRPGDGADGDAEWDRLNSLALSKLKFYVTPTVHSIVWKGDNLTAAEYYQRLWDLFLGGDVRTIQTLDNAWHSCHKRSNETLIQWWARFDGILAELHMMGVDKNNNEKKAKAIFLIGEEFATIAELYGSNEDDYMTFQRKVLKRDRDLRLFGLASDQRLADAFAGRHSNTTNVEMTNRALGDGSFAVTPRQSWRGTGFAPRGRGNREDRQRIEGGFRDNLAQEEADRQYLNSWGEEVNRLGEANDKFKEVETNVMDAMFAGNVVILHESAQTELLREC